MLIHILSAVSQMAKLECTNLLKNIKQQTSTVETYDVEHIFERSIINDSDCFKNAAFQHRFCKYNVDHGNCF